MIAEPDRRARSLLAALLLSSVVAAFAGVAHNGFIGLDDPEYLTENRIVARGLTGDGWRYAWTSFEAANWFPLTWLSHMLDVELFGMHPGAHHLAGLAFHALNALLCFLLVARWSGKPWCAFFAAALFALHPLRVESVAWAAERKDVLSACLFLATLHAWTSYARAPRPRTYALALACFALGLLAKQMLVTLPFLLLVLDRWPLERTARGWRALAVEKLPFFALAFAAVVAVVVAQHGGGALAAPAELGLGERVANALVSYGRYLALTTWPSGLAIYYPHARSTDAATALAAAALLVAITAWAWRVRARSPWILAGWLWYLGLCVPILGLIQVGGQSHADRYTYLSLLGPVLALVLELDSRLVSSRTRRAIAIAGCIVLASLGWRTREQVALWKDSRTVFAHAVAVTKDNGMAHQSLGNALLGLADFDGAIREFSEVLRIEPRFPDAANNLGQALAAAGRHEEAVARFREATLSGGDAPHVRSNLGWALLRLGRNAEAEAECRKAVELDPADSDARERLGVLLAALGRTEEAQVELSAAIRLDPDEPRHRRALELVVEAAEREAGIRR